MNKIKLQTRLDRDPSGCSVLKTSQSKELSPRAVQALRSLQARRDERLLLTG